MPGHRTHPSQVAPSTPTKRSALRGVALAAVFSMVSLAAPLDADRTAYASGGPAPIDVSGVTLEFLRDDTLQAPDPIENLGKNAALNTTITYPAIAEIGGVTIGAEVKVIVLDNIIGEAGDGSSLGGGAATTACTDKDFLVRNIDRADSDTPAEDRPLRHAINVCGGTDGWVEFTVRFFVLDGNNDKIDQPLQNLRVSVLELNRRQYLWAYNADSSRIPQGSAITRTSVVVGADTITKFESPNTDNANPIDSAEVFWAEASTIRYRVGMDRTGAGRGTGTIILSFAEGDFFPPESTSVQEPAVVTQARPAIALTPGFTVGDTACLATVGINGEGLQKDSSIRLTLGPMGTVLKSAAITGTSFGHVVSLPAQLSPGSYQLTLTATSAQGETLQLVRQFTVDARCVVTSLQPGVGSIQLAQTGPAGATGLLGLGATLVALGLALATTRRRAQARH